MTERAHVIVVGNEKGGTGKSTVSMHVIVSLLNMGLSVGSIDLDARQATLTRYVENRKARADAGKLSPRMPDHRSVLPSAHPEADQERFRETLEDLAGRHDVVVIDTPGADSPLSRHGHSFANTLITPLNDSLVDLDVLAKVDPETRRILRPSHYAEAVWETRKAKALRGEHDSFDWIVMRNRLSHLDARNKREMEALLADLSKRIRFRTVPGLGERVIYRSLFLEGLTLLDLRKTIAGIELNMSHIAARQELRALIDAIGLPALTGGKTAEMEQAGV